MVVPSRAESLPYIVLEAAGARMPMIATNVGGIPEIFGPYRDRLGPADDPTISPARMRCDARPCPRSERSAAAPPNSPLMSPKTSRSQTMVDSVLAGYREALGRTRVAAPARPPAR